MKDFVDSSDDEHIVEEEVQFTSASTTVKGQNKDKQQGPTGNEIFWLK